MKRLITILTVFLLLTALSGCSGTDPVIDSLPGYDSEVKYTRGVFQDYMDYIKYSYESVTAQTLEASTYFETVTAEDVKDILEYIDNFVGWVDTADDELKDHYDFNITTVSEGDFFYLVVDDDRFAYYTVYYFDIDTQTLYYFHNNF